MADVIPPDPDTETGQFRFLIGDVEYDLETGTYKRFSDGSIQSFLAQGDGNMNRAIGYAYLTLASQAAEQSKTVKDYDLQIDLTKRAGDLRNTAAMWFGMADADDERDGVGDIFDMGVVGGGCLRCQPEATPRPFYCGRC